MNSQPLPVIKTTEINLGDLISTLYEQFLVTYGNEETASMATAVAVNEILAQQPQSQDN